jgi:AcrR family transcriptional regulator
MLANTAAPTKRDQLVDIASALFYEQGFGATGIKQIIDTAGIAKGTFYSHFTSKEEVGVAWLKKRHAVWNSWVKAKLDEPRSAKGKIVALFDFLESWMSDCGFRGCAFLNTLSEVEDPENPMRQEIVSHKEGLHETIQSLAAEHFAGRSSAFAKQKGSIIFLLFEGALVESQNFRDTWPIVSARKEVKALLAAA